MKNDLLKEGQSENYLLVEGSDDKNMFFHLLTYYNLINRRSTEAKRFRDTNKHFEIKDHEGVDNLLNTLKVELKRGDVIRRCYGVVVDADEDLAATWQRLQNIFHKAGYKNIPRVPDANGTVLTQEGLPTVGIWLMPNNKLPGMMEDFISFLRPSEDVFWPMAEEVVVKVIEKGCHFRSSYKSKACLHTWLAWQEEPGKPMGQAITKRYVDADAIHAKQLISWFRNVFELERA